MKKYDFAFVTENAKADLKKAMQQYLDFETFRNDYGWADWMNDFTDAEDGESCTEEEIRIIDEVIYQVWKELKYYVCSPYKTSDDVEILLRTGDLKEAKAEADYFASRGQSVEVQEVTAWNFGGYDYNVVYKKYDEAPEYYYWLDTEYLFGDYSVKKWALMRGKFTDDGERDRDTEEVLTWGEIPETEDMNEAWNQIDEAIEAKLGFVPDYEVN